MSERSGKGSTLWEGKDVSVRTEGAKGKDEGEKRTMGGMTEYSCQVEIIRETHQSLAYVEAFDRIKILTCVVAVLNLIKRMSEMQLDAVRREYAL